VILEAVFLTDRQAHCLEQFKNAWGQEGEQLFWEEGEQLFWEVLSWEFLQDEANG
jgi:hypothetical protein